jgi:HlyD family secretion protein
MTALVRIVTVERTDALLVPNAALRFEPEAGASPAPPRGESVAGSEGQPAQVWMRGHYGRLSRVDINIGVSDGSVTEVVSGPLSAGEAVAIGREIAGNERTFLGIRLGF